MGAIFISYRIASMSSDAKLVSKNLKEKIKPHIIHIDKEIIEPGDIFPERLEQALTNSKVILLMIDPEWKLGGSEDWVRKEIEMGLNQGKVFLPMLIRRAPIPEDLPPRIRDVYQSFFFEGNLTESKDPEWMRLANTIKRLLSDKEEFDPHPNPLIDLVKAVVIVSLILIILILIL